MQAKHRPALPPPDPASQAHSNRCAAFLRERIRAAGGSISFADYMQAALYAPGLGYYAAGAAKLGAAGDFVTAPEISPLYGRVLGQACSEVLSTLGGGDILEFGAGSGRLAIDVLGRLAGLRTLPRRYFILEVSADLRQRQQQLIASALPEIAERVHWLDALPEAHRGVIIANEVLDALPVERFVAGEEARQLYVAVDGNGFAFREAPVAPELSSALASIESDLGQLLPPGYTSEFSPLAAPWTASLCDCLEAGVAFLFDYGTSRSGYYAPDRSSGWLRCHYRHHAHDDPLILPGIQDITCWVDFSLVAGAAVAAGADIAAYVTQADFLLSGGLLQEAAIQPTADARAQLELAAQVKTLTLPGEMGERFKCLALAKHVEVLPAAISFRDRTHTL